MNQPGAVIPKMSRLFSTPPPTNTPLRWKEAVVAKAAPPAAAQTLIAGQCRAGGSKTAKDANNASALHVAVGSPQTAAGATEDVEAGPVVSCGDRRRSLGIRASPEISRRCRSSECRHS